MFCELIDLDRSHPRLALVNELNTVVRLFDVSDLSLRDIRELSLNLGVAPVTKLMKLEKLDELWGKERELVVLQRAQKSEDTSDVLNHEEHDLIIDSHEPKIEIQDVETVETKPLSKKEKRRIKKLHKIELNAESMIKHYQKKDLK